ncbi:MAG: hypothetical protein R3F43_11360 [bacterium]
MPFSAPYLRRLLEAPEVPTLQVGVYAQGALQAAALVPYDGRRGWYLHGGVRRPGPVGAAVLRTWTSWPACASAGWRPATWEASAPRPRIPASPASPTSAALRR